MSDARAQLLDHLKQNSLRTDGPFTLSSGGMADWYLDARQTTFSAVGGPLVAAAVMEILDPGVTAVGGMTMGADPIAFATAFASHGRIDAFSIRKESKQHGTGGRLVGPVPPGARVTIVEDTTTTGSAFVEAVDVAVDHGLQVAQAVVLVDRSGGAAEAAMSQRSIAYRALAHPADLGVS